VSRVSPLRPEARAAAAPGPPALGSPAFEPGPSAFEPGPPAFEPGPSVPTYSEPEDLSVGGGDRDDEPPLPDEARDRALAANTAPTRPVDARPGGILHVRFRQAAGTDRLVGAMEEVRALLRARPGGTPVVLHLPQGGGRTALPMELRTRVAYDAELLAELDRRLGDGVVELSLA